ncbi:hypothetical protein OC861_005859 [Tilletia horrida]|nr:hypothetical protein OC861_005859 [Tilletia horrida]
MRVTLPFLLLGAAVAASPSNVVRQCVTGLINEASSTANAGPTPTYILPAKTVTVFHNGGSTHAHAKRQVTVTTTVTVPATATDIQGMTKTVTGKPIAATTSRTITTGGPGGTTTITSYTQPAPAPSLASPVFRRREQSQRASAGLVETLAKELHFNHNDTRLSNGVDRALFSDTDDDPELNDRATVYCSDVVTRTVSGSAPHKARDMQERLLLFPPATKTVTVYVTSGVVTATKMVATTVTYFPVTKTVTATVQVPASPTATAVVPGYDVCNPAKAGPLEDWTAYQANALAFGLTTFANITEPGDCCAAAAAQQGALAWSICDGTSGASASCTRGTAGPCFVLYLKTLPFVATVQDQCQASNDASTFQYRRGSGQIGGPLQCASTYEPYRCVRAVLGLLGDNVCSPLE